MDSAVDLVDFSSLHGNKTMLHVGGREPLYGAVQCIMGNGHIGTTSLAGGNRTIAVVHPIAIDIVELISGVNTPQSIKDVSWARLC